MDVRGENTSDDQFSIRIVFVCVLGHDSDNYVSVKPAFCLHPASISPPDPAGFRTELSLVAEHHAQLQCDQPPR